MKKIYIFIFLIFLGQVIKAQSCLPISGGTLITFQSSYCIGSELLLNITGQSVGSNYLYYWEESVDSVNWAFLTNGVQTLINPQYLFRIMNYDSVYFRYKVKCLSGIDSAYSDVIKITTIPSEFCYCSDVFFTACTFTIDSIQILNTNINFSSSCFSMPTINYPLTANNNGNLQQGSNYELKLKFSNNSGNGGAWFDFDNNLEFDFYEYIPFTIANNKATILFKVPFNAPLGTVGVRITSYSGLPPANAEYEPCLTNFNNSLAGHETEDFFINVVNGTFCSTTPPTPIIKLGNDGCPNEPIVVTINDSSLTSGNYIFWEESYDGGTSWSYVDSNYYHFSYLPSLLQDSLLVRAIVGCNAGPSVYSNNKVIKVKDDFSTCYCNSQATSALRYDISNVILARQNNVLINNTSTCTSLAPGPNSIVKRYSNYASSIPAPNVFFGDTLQFSVTSTTCNLTNLKNGVKIYIDMNRDLFFDPVDELYYSQDTGINGAHTETGVIVIPKDTFSTDPFRFGKTLIRVISLEAITFNQISPCQTYPYGETEDYFIELTNPLLTTINTKYNKTTDISLYPNPVQNVLNINAYHSNIDGLTIFDVYGKQAKFNIISKSEHNLSINTENITNGLYFISVTSGLEKAYLKFIKN